MQNKTWMLLGLTTLFSAPLYSQPTSGAVYWSTTQPDCSSLNETAVAIQNAAGKNIGYSCYVSGTFVWLAAGGGWSTSIRVAAPASAPIGVNYLFYDPNGNGLSVDTTLNSAPASLASGNEVKFALSADQPAEVELLGAKGNGPAYGTTTTGSVYAVFYCPDATTCGNVLPQLLYSALPMEPWSLSVPIVFDVGVWTQWSAVGINGPGQVVSMVIYNEAAVANTYTVSVFDGSGKLVGSGITPLIPAGQNLGNGNYGQGGTYGVLLSQVVTSLPQGVFKVVVDGGVYSSAVEVLQFNGPSATSLQVAYDSSPAVQPGARLRALPLRRSGAHPFAKAGF